MTRLLRRALAGAALVALLPLGVATAHAELESASPGPDEVAPGSPPRLVARFTQDLAADRTSIEVRDAAGQTIARGGKDPDRARVQRLDLPPLAPGTYEVRWVTFSAEDDELARGRYRFTVTEAPTTPAPSPITACSSPVAAASPVVSLPVASMPVASVPSPSPVASPLGGSPAAAASPPAATTTQPPSTVQPLGTPVPMASPAPSATIDHCATPAPSPSPSASSAVSTFSPEANLVP